jgi:hypothetical protein
MSIACSLATTALMVRRLVKYTDRVTEFADDPAQLALAIASQPSASATKA